MLLAAAKVASDGHAKRGRKRRARVTSAVAVVLAFGTQKKTVEPAKLAHRVKTIETPGKHFVDIALVTHVHDEAITRRVEHAMQGNRQLNHAKVRPEMSSSLGKDFDQFIAHFLCKLRQLLFAQRFDICWRTDAVEQARGRGCRL